MAQITPSYNNPLPLATRDLDPLRVMRQMMRWDPFETLAPQIFGERQTMFSPAFDVAETDDAYLFMADVPGLRDQDIDISVTGSRISINGRREQDQRQEGQNFFHAERSYGQFTRTFTLPDGCRMDDVQANLDNGVLTVTVPKTPEVQARKVQVTGATQPNVNKQQKKIQ
jgi:HSP20 family protein